MPARAWRLKTKNYKHPKFQFTHKLKTKSRHNLTKSKFLAMLHRQCKVNGKLKLANAIHFALARCNISENLLFVRLWREFIINLWVNWNLGCLKNCFNSPGSSARLHSLFQCILRLSGIVLRVWAPESAEILRGVCSHINVDDLRLFFELLVWNIDV